MFGMFIWILTSNKQFEFKINDIMDSSHKCPNCLNRYSDKNPPKKLINCKHRVCLYCLKTTSTCNIDKLKLQVRRYGLIKFQTDNCILNGIYNSNSKDNAPSTLDKLEGVSEAGTQSNEFLKSYEKKMRSIDLGSNPMLSKNLNRTSMPQTKGENLRQDICLLHSKPLEVVCVRQGTLICSNCALFGQHKGHIVKSKKQVISHLQTFTDQNINQLDHLKEIMCFINEDSLENFLQEQFTQKRQKQLKAIRTSFSKLYDKIRKCQRAAISQLDQIIKRTKIQASKDWGLQSIVKRVDSWYLQVSELGTAMEQIYSHNSFEKASEYLDEQKEQSFLLKKGQYLACEVRGFEKQIKDKINEKLNKLEAIVNPEVQPSIQKYYTLNDEFKSTQNSSKKGQTKEALQQMLSKTISTPKNTKIRSNSQKQVEDVLLDTEIKNMGLQAPNDSQKITKSISTNCTPDEINSSSKEQKNNSYAPVRSFYQKSLKSSRRSIRPTSRPSSRPSSKASNRSSISSRKSNLSNMNNSRRQLNSSISYNMKDMCVKRRKVQIPERFRKSWIDLQNDSADVIDFTGAQLEDLGVLGLCDDISATRTVKSLKLIRNKLTDRHIQTIMQAAKQSEISSLNLSQNSLTEKTLRIIEMWEDYGNLKTIILSLNKMSLRTVRERLQKLKKKGITVSL